MVEGRISAGVVVGDGTDIGGGASIMGTLSGGGKQVVSIGERWLGANSGTGIALGHDCIVEAGCYVTACTLVRQMTGEVVKAVALSGKSNILFRRHSQTGAIEAIPRNRSWAVSTRRCMRLNRRPGVIFGASGDMFAENRKTSVTVTRARYRENRNAVRVRSDLAS